MKKQNMTKEEIERRSGDYVFSKYDHGGCRIYIKGESGDRQLLIDTFYDSDFSDYINDRVREYFNLDRIEVDHSEVRNETPDFKVDLMKLKLSLLCQGFDITESNEEKLKAERRETDEHRKLEVKAYKLLDGVKVVHSADGTFTGSESIIHFDLEKFLNMPFAKRAWISSIVIILSVANLYLI